MNRAAVPAPKSPRERLLDLANAEGPRAETWRRALVAILEDLNRAVHHERFRRAARLPRAPMATRLDVLPWPGGASARVALGCDARIAPKDVPAFTEAVRQVVERLHKPKRGPFVVRVRYDDPDDESCPALHWPLGMGREATTLWHDLVGEPAGSAWRRVSATPTTPRDRKSPPAPLELPPPSADPTAICVALARVLAKPKASKDVATLGPIAQRAAVILGSPRRARKARRA